MRRFFTEEEHVLMVRVGDEFWEALGKLTADALNKMPKEVEDHAMVYLQDLASLYGTNYPDHLIKDRP
jgi:hypothetical protein